MKTRLSLLDAEKWFKHFGCSGFFMNREDSDLYASYKSLKISKAQEIEWTEESFRELINSLDDDSTAPASLWAKQSNATRLAESIRRDTVLWDLHEASRRILDKIPPDDCIMCAENLLGRTNLALRQGVIFLSLALGSPILARRFLALAGDFATRYGGRDIARYEEAMRRAEIIGATLDAEPNHAAG
jgi:hypothetical protein